MFEKKLIASRQAFANAMDARIPKEEVMRTLGIAQSTYYKWKAQLGEYGLQWVNGEPINNSKWFTNLTVESTHKQIVEFSLLYPTLGPIALAVKIAMDHGFPLISSSAIHNILSKQNLGNRARRAAELLRRSKELNRPSI